MEVDKKATEVNFVRPRHERERDSALAVATLRQITVIQGILRRRAISFEVASRDLLRGKCVIAERRRRHRPIFTRCRSKVRRRARARACVCVCPCVSLSLSLSLSPSLTVVLPRFFGDPDLAVRLLGREGGRGWEDQSFLSSCLLAPQMN